MGPAADVGHENVSSGIRVFHGFVNLGHADHSNAGDQHSTGVGGAGVQGLVVSGGESVDGIPSLRGWNTSPLSEVKAGGLGIKPPQPIQHPITACWTGRASPSAWTWQHQCGTAGKAVLQSLGAPAAPEIPHQPPGAQALLQFPFPVRQSSSGIKAPITMEFNPKSVGQVCSGPKQQHSLSSGTG